MYSEWSFSTAVWTRPKVREIIKFIYIVWYHGNGWWAKITLVLAWFVCITENGTAVIFYVHPILILKSVQNFQTVRQLRFKLRANAIPWRFIISRRFFREGGGAKYPLFKHLLSAEVRRGRSIVWIKWWDCLIQAINPLKHWSSQQEQGDSLFIPHMYLRMDYKKW